MNPVENKQTAADTDSTKAIESSAQSNTQAEKKAENLHESHSSYHPLQASDPQENEGNGDDFSKEHDPKETEWSDPITTDERTNEKVDDAGHHLHDDGKSRSEKKREKDAQIKNSDTPKGTATHNSSEVRREKSMKTSRRDIKPSESGKFEDVHRRYYDRKGYEPPTRGDAYKYSTDRESHYRYSNEKRERSRSHERHNHKASHDREYDTHRDASFHKDSRKDERKYDDHSSYEGRFGYKGQHSSYLPRQRNPVMWGHIQEPEATSLYVRFSFGTTNEEFTKTFQRFGTTTKIHFDEMKGFGFVCYSSKEGADKALAASGAHEILLHGEEPTIRIETERQSISRAPNRPYAGPAGTNSQQFRSWNKRQDGDFREHRRLDENGPRFERQRDRSRNRQEQQFRRKDSDARERFDDRKPFWNRENHDFTWNREKTRSDKERGRDEIFSERRYTSDIRRYESQPYHSDHDRNDRRRERSPARASNRK